MTNKVTAERTVYVLSPGVDPTHMKAHELVRSGQAAEVRIETGDGYVLFRAWDHGSQKQYAWQTSQMAAPAFWDKEREQA